MRSRFLSSVSQWVALAGVASLGLMTMPASAYCPLQCASNYSNYCVSLCGLDRRSPDQIEAARKAEEERQAQTKKVLAEFTTRRDKLRTTDPSGPQFKAVFEAYKKARRQRDGDLLGAYLAATEQNMVGVLLTGGTVLQVLDEPYGLPPHSRSAFHEYAAAQMNRILNGASILSIFNEDGSVASSDEGSSKGSYGRYASLADKEELDIWKKAHGVAVEPFPPEPVDPADEARRQQRAKQAQADEERRAAGQIYGKCVMAHFQRGQRPTTTEFRAAEMDCKELKPVRR